MTRIFISYDIFPHRIPISLFPIFSLLNYLLSFTTKACYSDVTSTFLLSHLSDLRKLTRTRHPSITRWMVLLFVTLSLCKSLYSCPSVKNTTVKTLKITYTLNFTTYGSTWDFYSNNTSYNSINRIFNPDELSNIGGGCNWDSNVTLNEISSPVTICTTFVSKPFKDSFPRIIVKEVAQIVDWFTSDIWWPPISTPLYS